MNLINDISLLKKQKNAIILAHYYQDPDIQDIADYIGDSLGLSQRAAESQAKIIVFAGVHFMAETAKILNPTSKVLIPDMNAGCSLADTCPPDKFRNFVDIHPNHTVISYINCSAEIKAMSDIICTSSNALKIVNSLPENEKIIFAPDKNLGKYIMKMSGRDMVLWNGSCMVHELFSEKKLIELKVENEDAEIIAHPECEEPILKLADYIGSTTALIEYVKKKNTKKFIVATESGILHQMQKYAPQATLIAAPPENNCACNDCPYMKLNTMEKIYLCLRDENPELIMNEDLRIRAEKPIRRMLSLS
jgi:quinolinate synthase